MAKTGQTRIAEDEHGPRATYDDIEVGQELEELKWIVTEDDIENQCQMDEDFHEWYVLDSPWGGRVAPPQIQYRPPRWQLSRTFNVRGVFYKWTLENIRPIKPGDEITVRGKILNKWIHKQREFIEFESIGSNANDDIVFRTTRVHVLDVVKRDAPRSGVGIDSGIKNEKI